MYKNHSAGVAAALFVFAGLAGQSRAQSTIFTEDFTQGASSNQWYYFNGACLTAGTSPGGGTPGTKAGLLPSCMSILGSYYQKAPDKDPVLNGGYSGTLPDPVGNGALRFTNGYPYGHDENGAIVSSTPFNAGNGLKISFKTITYRGDSGGTGKDGADGLSFYLLDATTYTPTNNAAGIWNGIGSWGGSLAYTCSNKNPPFDGVVAGYLGVGIDEFGNFLNGEALEPGYTGPNVATGDNTALGYGYHPGRIGLRGPGSVAWKYLNATDPNDYPSNLSTANQQTAVQNTCKSGLLYHNVQSGSSFTSTPTTTTVYDYAPIPNAYSELPSGYPIANEAAQTRPAAAGNGTSTGNTILYNLTITQTGLLTFNYSYNGGALQNIVNGQDISTSAYPLPASLLFAFAGSSGGDTNIHEILCFQAAPQDTSSSSSTTNQQQTGEVQTNAQAYFAFYDPNDWTGRLTAFNIIDTNGVLSIASLANWDAQCVLTGLASNSANCPTTGAVGPQAAEGPTSRVMLTWNGTDIDTGADQGTSGIPFEWPPNTAGGLTTLEQKVIDAGDTGAYTTGGAYNGNRVNYLRGDRTNEITSTGTGLFRMRDGVLGDIVDSSPTWVGPPSSPYVLSWKDRYSPGDAMPENTGQSYSSFQALEQGRLNVVYVGANDGFLHGFRSGSETTAGVLVNNSQTPNDGAEVLAYMPGSVLGTIHNATNSTLDYSSASYVHNFYVDATPGAGDLFFNGTWHTWLAGGLGAGGAAIYALDVTNPTAAGSTQFIEKNASSLVVGEWSAATIACANDTSGSGCGVNLGNTYGTPLIRRLHNGMWGVIFGNGFGSASGDAGIFVMTVDQSGNKTFYYLSTGTAGTGNGIGYVTAADLDGDHITDFVYAGDLLGNVWRFDLSACSPTTATTGTCTVSAGWGVNSNSATGKPVPLFQDPAGQPITTPVVLASFATSPTAAPQLLVSWGTGQRTQVTVTSGISYAAGVQSLYGVWDWNLSNWNLNSTSQYASLTAAEENCGAGKGCGGGGTTAPVPLTNANLLRQTFTDVGTAVDTTNLPLTWITCSAASPSTCTSGVFGWYANLPGSSEQIVSAPTIYQQSLIVNSTIPANNSVLSCTVSNDTGITYVLSITTGGTFVTSATGSSSGSSGSSSGGSSANNLQSGFMNSNGDRNMVGQQTNETGAATVLNTKEGTTWFYGQAITPVLGQTPTTPTQLNLPPNISVNRVTWVELR
jgi:type IV pilus assembly protein PilY1